MLILHPRDQPPIGGAYQPADWDAPLADDPFFSLFLLSREREKKRKKPAAKTKRRKPQTFVRSTTTRRAATLFNRVRRTSDNKVQTRRSTFDRSSRIETNRSPRVARAPFHSVQFRSVVRRAYLDRPSHRFSRASSKHLARLVRPRRTDDGRRRVLHPGPALAAFFWADFCSRRRFHSDIRTFVTSMDWKTLKKLHD